MSTLTLVNLRARAACADADPDLFFPEPNTAAEQITQAKQVCAVCPLKQTCLEDAMRHGEADGIRGGLTVEERQALLRPADSPAPERVRRPGKASAKEIATRHGAHLLACLVEWKMSVQQAAFELGSTPSSVYRAYRMLVPAQLGLPRPHKPPAIEELLRTSMHQLKTLERRGISQSEIGIVLNTPQTMVSAALAVLRQRETAVEALSKDGQDGLARLQAEEVRIRRESGAGLTVQDVIEMAGAEIWRMHGEGMPLRKVALELGLCREAVRKAYLEMTNKQVVKNLTQNEMGEAA